MRQSEFPAKAGRDDELADLPVHALELLLILDVRQEIVDDGRASDARLEAFGDCSAQKARLALRMAYLLDRVCFGEDDCLNQIDDLAPLFQRQTDHPVRPVLDPKITESVG